VTREVGTSRRTFRRTLGSGVARALVVPATSFVVLPLVLDDLGTEAYGVWATMSSLLAVGGLVDAGVRTEIVRRVADSYGSGDRAAGVRAARQGATILAVSASLLAAVVALFSWPIVDFVFPDLSLALRDDTHGVLVGLAVVLAVSIVNGGLFSIAAGLQRGDFENVGAVVAAVTGALVTVVSVDALDLGLWGMFWGAAANVLVMVLGQTVATRTLTPALRLPFTRVGTAVVRSYFAVSALLFLSQVGDVVDFQYDKIVLSRYVGPEAAGQYQLGTMLSLNLRLLALLPMTLLLAGTAELWRTAPAKAGRLLEVVTAFVYGVGGLLMTGVIVLAPAFMELWLGTGYEDAARAAQLLAVAMVLNLVAAPWSGLAIGRRWVGIPAAAAIGNMVTNAVLSFVLVTHIGFDGALYGSIAGNAVGLVVFYVVLRWRTGEGRLRPVLRPLLVCGVAGMGAAGVLTELPGSADAWPGFLAWACGLSAVIAAGLYVALPQHLRAEVRGALRGRRVLT
jgi:O-antigen/teichoic acid export membrane protein